MTTLQLTVTLPDDLARRAEAAGLLTPERLSVVLEWELRRILASEQMKVGVDMGTQGVINTMRDELHER